MTTRSGHHQRGASVAADDRGIRHGEDGRGIHDQGVKLLTQLLQQPFKAQVHEQFRRVGGDLARGHHPQVGYAGGLYDVFDACRAGHVFADAGFTAQAEFLVDVALAQVGIHNHHALAGLGQHGTQIF